MVLTTMAIVYHCSCLCSKGEMSSDEVCEIFLSYVSAIVVLFSIAFFCDVFIPSNDDHYRL